MKSPSNSLYKETLSESLQVPVKKRTGRIRFAMLPADVLRDPKLPPTAKLALQGMAMEAYGAGELAISHQALANVCGSSRPTILQGLKHLCRAGLIEKMGDPEKQVQRYRFLHPKFAVKSPPKPGSIAAQNRGIPVACPQCRRICKRLPRIGVCRTCSTEARTERTARRVVREELASVRTA